MYNQKKLWFSCLNLGNIGCDSFSFLQSLFFQESINLLVYPWSFINHVVFSIACKPHVHCHGTHNLWVDACTPLLKGPHSKEMVLTSS